MFTINIITDSQSAAVSIFSGHTPRQIIDYLRQNGLVPQFQGNYYLQFDGDVLPLDAPVGNHGVGPSDTLRVVSQKRTGFGGSGKETLLTQLLKAFTNLK